MKTASRTIIFIHGLFMIPKSWDTWKAYFESKGYKCHTPAYPFHEGLPNDLKKNSHPNLGQLTFDKVLESLTQFIDSLKEKPILIGHSMGGLAVQKLIAMDKGVMGICIDSAPPKGISNFKWSFIKSNFPVINPFKGDSVFEPTVKWFQYAFCNTMTLEQTQKVFDAFVVSESRNIPRSSIKEAGYIDFKKAHQPLLFIAGEKDNIVPAALNQKNFDAYSDKNSRKNFKLFSERTHYICGQDNWQEVADYIYNWIEKT
jgi:esterase/lipase